MEYQDRDITKDPAALEELMKLKAMTTPVIVIGQTVIVGYDIEKIDAALSAG